jgi:sugar lactone lactonase YvrE
MDFLGNLYVSDLTHGGSLWKVTPTQQVSEVVFNLGFATGVTIAPDGVNVLVSATFENKIWKVAPNGATSVYANISGPWALAFDPAGNLLVGQPSQISRIAPDGSQSVFATGLHDVRGIAYVPEPAGVTSAIAALTWILCGRWARRGI